MPHSTQTQIISARLGPWYRSIVSWKFSPPLLTQTGRDDRSRELDNYVICFEIIFENEMNAAPCSNNYVLRTPRVRPHTVQTELSSLTTFPFARAIQTILYALCWPRTHSQTPLKNFIIPSPMLIDARLRLVRLPNETLHSSLHQTEYLDFLSAWYTV